MLISLTLCVGMASCGDDDDPPFDPSNPFFGTWIVQDVSNWDYHGYMGQLLMDEEQSARDFYNDWMGKSIKVSSKTKIEEDIITIDESSLQKEYLEVVSNSENEMSVHYVLLKYSGEQISSKTTASMQLKRK